MSAFNWDTVYGVSADRISKALAAQKDQMASALSYAEDGYALNGNFEIWAVADGSADTLMNLRLSFAGCDLTRPDGSTLSQFKAVVEVQVRLELLTVNEAARTASMKDFVGRVIAGEDPQPPPPSVTQLSFRVQQVGAAEEAPLPGVVSLIHRGSALSATDAEDDDLAFVETAVLAWLTQQAATLTFVLAIIGRPPGLPAWMVPAQSRFCIKNAGGRTMFFVMSVMDARAIPPDETNVDDDLLKGVGSGAWEACFYLDPQLFLQHVVMPALPATLGNGCSADKFSYADGVIRGDYIDLPEVHVSGDPFTYEPQMDGVTLNLATDKLHCKIDGSCGLKLGVKMNFTCESWNPFGFDPATGVLRFAADPNPQTTHDIPAGGKVLAGLFGFLGGLFTAGPVGAIAGTVVSQVLINKVSDSIDNKAQFQISIDSPTFVQWFGAGEFTITEAALDDGVFLKGNLSHVSRRIPATTADALGWDVVYAITDADMNRCIQQAWNVPDARVPKTFKFQTPDNTASIDGNFGPWRLVYGGAEGFAKPSVDGPWRRVSGGPWIRFALPIPTGVVNLRNASLNLQNLTATVQVDCSKAMAPLPPPSEADGSVAVVRVLSIGHDVPEDQGLFDLTVLEMMLERWLNGNLVAITQVFQTVDLPKQLATANDPPPAWLVPTSTAYAAYSTASDGSCVFGILSTTEGRSSVGLPLQVSPLAIPPGARAGLLVSPRLAPLLNAVADKLKWPGSAELKVISDFRDGCCMQLGVDPDFGSSPS